MITPLAGGAIAGLALAAVVFALDRIALATIRPPKQTYRRTVEGLPFESRQHPFSSSGQTLQGWVVEPEIESDGSARRPRSWLGLKPRQPDSLGRSPSSGRSSGFSLRYQAPWRKPPGSVCHGQALSG